eukprot:11537379-Prorocentrum_lima.AAC.1
MTSSLVGSEMCIRDRPCLQHSPCSTNTRNLVGTCILDGLPAQRRVQAVSYTHLTLPTICSV